MAFNKLLKPFIIVNNIIIMELNIGLTLPELEILKISNLAEDRF